MANVVLIPNELSGLNYSIAPSVSGSDLTVAIKDAAGNNPTSTSPCVFRVGGSERILSTSLSVTKADGTNWANLGGAQLATLEQDLFVYIVWNTNTSALDVLWSRIPYASVYGDFNSTSTSAKYGAINATAPASTDNVVNIGRFAATLSAGAGYTWTVPTYTASNLKQYPIQHSRLLSYVPTWVASGTAVAMGNSTLTGTYKFEGRSVVVRFYFTAGDTGTTFGTGTYSWALPLAPSVTCYGSAKILDATTAWFTLTVEATTGGVIVGYPSATSIVGASIPMTWAAGDGISGQVTIEL